MPEPILSASGKSHRPLPDVEKVEKSSVPKTRQTAIRWNIAAQHHLRPVEDGARCPTTNWLVPPADFLNAALVGLPEIEHRRKGVFQHNPPKAVVRRALAEWVKSTQNGRSPDLLDNFVGARQHRLRHSEAQRLGGPEIDDQFEGRRLLDRQIGGLGAREDLSRLRADQAIAKS